MKNTSTKYIILLFLVFGTIQTKAQAELQLVPSLQCGTYTYCVDIQLKASSSNNFDLGTSSVFLNYNSDALTFSSYTATDFDSLSACTNAWSPQQFDLDQDSGEFHVTMKLLNPSSTCINVDAVTPKVVGTICFQIEQQGGVPEITFDTSWTYFNTALNDNGSNPLTLNAWDSIFTANQLICDCPGIGITCNDNNPFTTNDVYDLNCDCAGTLEDADEDGIADGVDPCQDVVYEAEDAYFVGNVAINHLHYFGTGFIDWHAWQNDTVKFTVNVATADTHDIKIRYSNGNSYNRELKLTIDGVLVNDTLTFVPTDTSWKVWSTRTVSHYFTPGTHEILFWSNSWNEPNLDRITLSHCNGCATAGQWCDDGDSCTILDVTDLNCNCAGILMDSDNDGVCDASDICALGDDNIDTDLDGTPDACDDCNNNLVGTACDDGNPCTINDAFDANCDCVGTATGTDSDGDGVCDAYDICAGGDDNIDSDNDFIPDFCDSCDNRTIGMPCDDGNPCTVLDVVQQDCGCKGTDYYLIVTENITDLSCLNAQDGEINVTLQNSLGDVSYVWNHGDSVSHIKDLAAGNYSVTISDFRNCMDSVSFIVTEPDSLAATYSTVAASDTNGSISLSMTGGTQPYIYTWDNGDSTTQLNDLIPLTYTVSVTDANNCLTVVPIDILPADMCIDTLIQAENGILNGMGIDIWNQRWALGDGFIYLTDDSTQSASYQIHIPSDGFYTIGFRYTDKWATRTAKISINNVVEFPAFEFPRTYDWTVWKRAEFVDYFTTGTHTLTIAHAGDNWGPWIDFISVCNQVVVPIETDAVIIDNTCYGESFGSIASHSTGGTRNYTYLWSTGDTTASIDSLLAGDYYLTVTDEVGKTSVDTFTVGQPPEIINTFTIRDVKCNGESNGRAWTNVTGGSTSWYIYQWSHGLPWSNSGNVASGTYTVTITDGVNCSVVDTVFIPEPDTIEAFFNNTVSTGNDGAIDMTVTGGNPPYVYQWNDTSLTTQDRTNLAIGYYRVTITDTLNCKLKTRTDVFPAGICLDSVIQAEEGIVQNMSHQIWYSKGFAGRGYIHFSNDTTGQATYTITVPQNGYYAVGFWMSAKFADLGFEVWIDNIQVQPYFVCPRTYDWKTLIFKDFTQYLTAGTHTLTLKHADDWGPRIDFMTICDLSIETDIAKVNVTCHGDSTGSATVFASGGSGQLSYLWSNGNTTNSIANLPAGTYYITVTDTLSQSVTDTVEIQAPQPVQPILTTVDIDCNGNANGQILTSVSGGTGIYTYSWNNNATTSNINNLDTGTYSIVVTDSVGCTGMASATIIQPTMLTSSIGNIIHVDCFGNGTGSATVTPQGGNGGYAYQWTSSSISATANNLIAGSYTVTVTDVKGCQSTSNITITQPTALNLILPTVQNVSCFGGNDGQIQSTVSGGTMGYSYQWSTNDTTMNAQNLTAGNYILTVTDANGCTISQSASVTQPTPLLSNITNVTDIDCNGNTNGSVTIAASGGTANYNYNWSNGDATTLADSLGTGTFTVTITDANGCTTTDSATIIEPPVLTVSGTVSNTTGNDGSIDITPQGGTPNYTFAWSDAVNTEDRTNLTAANYHVTITDANGCTTSDVYSIYDATTCLDDIYQGENAVVSNGATAIFNDATGALGTGYVGFGTDTTELLTFNVQVPTDTFYSISIRYTQGDGDVPMEMSLNGNVEYAHLNFPKTTNWNTWEYLTIKQELTAGNHTIQFRNGAGNGANIDYISLCVTEPDTTTSITIIPSRNKPTLQSYPNPATQLLNIDVALKDAKEGTLTIFDVSGRVHFQQVLDNNGRSIIQTIVNVSRFGEGIYFVRLETELGTLVKKVTVLR